MQWGEECPEHLLGDFAFAVYDPSQKRLFCSRSAMGGGLFNFVVNKDFFAFSSNPESLIGLPGVTPAPNEKLIAYLLTRKVSGTKTDRRGWHRDILQLSAGESISISSDGSYRFFTNGFSVPEQSEHYAALEACQEHFDEVFGEAVRCRLRGVEHPAVLLSGGLDSAGVLAEMRRELSSMPEQRIFGYSVLDEKEEPSVESKAIQTLAGLPGISPITYGFPEGAGGDVNDLLEAAWAQTHPLENSVLVVALLFKLAQRNGHGILMHGACGDVTMDTPNDYVVHHLKSWDLLGAWRESRAAARNHVYLNHHHASSIFSRAAYKAFVPSPIRQLVRQGRQSMSSDEERFRFVTHEFIERLGLRASNTKGNSEVGEDYGPMADRLASRSLVARVQTTQSSATQLAARFGVVSRDPFSDIRVVDFFLRLPLEMKVCEGWTKYLLRQTLRNQIPESVLWRTDKHHVGRSLVPYLMRQSKSIVDRAVQDDFHYVESYLNKKEVMSLWSRASENPQNPSDQHKLYRIVTLIRWIKRVNSLA
jgi:asparagine synthase (glutamine-hydrolysing)